FSTRFAANSVHHDRRDLRRQVHRPGRRRRQEITLRSFADAVELIRPSVAQISVLDWALIVVLNTLTLPGCAPFPKAEYRDGFFRHLHPPRYTVQVPDGWRQAATSDYPSLGFNR